MFRIVAIGALLVALLITVKDQRVLQHAHLVGFCSTVASDATGSEWRKCVSGRLSGRPGLELNGCTDWGPYDEAEYWNCPARLDTNAMRE
jgi:hypothetical protein